MVGNSNSTFATNITSESVPDYYYCEEMLTGPYIWATISILSFCVGMPAGVWLLWVLLQRHRRGMTSDIYLLNIIIMDFIFNLFSVPGIMNYLLFRSNAYAKVADVIYCLGSVGRPLLMACTCVDCYIAVVHPILYMKVKSAHYRPVVCGATWAVTLMYGFIIVFNPGIYQTLYFSIPYMLSLPAIVTCDAGIVRVLKKPDPSGKRDVHPQKQRAMETITSSLVMAVVSYLPPLVGGFLNLQEVSLKVKMCNITIPTLVAPLIGSSVLALMSLQNLGELRAWRRFGWLSKQEPP